MSPIVINYFSKTTLRVSYFGLYSPTIKCRGGPRCASQPVAPLYPMSCPFFTLSPTFTSKPFLRCSYSEYSPLGCPISTKFPYFSNFFCGPPISEPSKISTTTPPSAAFTGVSSVTMKSTEWRSGPTCAGDSLYEILPIRLLSIGSLYTFFVFMSNHESITFQSHLVYIQPNYQPSIITSPTILSVPVL